MSIYHLFLLKNKYIEIISNWLENKNKSDDEILNIIINNKDSLLYWTFNNDWSWNGNKRYNNILKKLEKDLIY